MPTAKEMFEEIAWYEDDREDIYLVFVNKNTGNLIVFGLESKTLYLDTYGVLSINEHLAIHQKMKELGWIE